MKEGGAPVVVVLGLVVCFRMWINRTPGESKPWVIRLEHSIADDTLVRLAALVKRLVSGKREPRPEPETSDEPVDITPEQPPRVRGKTWR